MSKNNKTSLGVDENIEGFLTYLLLWITGIVFLVVEKDNKFVRFHAMQSTITFLGLTILDLIFLYVPLIGRALTVIVDITILITWLICMIEAYLGEKFKLPVIGDLSEELLKKIK